MLKRTGCPVIGPENVMGTSRGSEPTAKPGGPMVGTGCPGAIVTGSPEAGIAGSSTGGIAGSSGASTIGSPMPSLGLASGAALAGAVLSVSPAVELGAAGNCSATASTGAPGVLVD